MGAMQHTGARQKKENFPENHRCQTNFQPHTLGFVARAHIGNEGINMRAKSIIVALVVHPVETLELRPFPKSSSLMQHSSWAKMKLGAISVKGGERLIVTTPKGWSGVKVAEQMGLRRGGAEGV